MLLALLARGVSSHTVIFVDTPAILKIFRLIRILTFVWKPVLVLAVFINALNVGILTLQIADKTNHWVFFITTEVFI